MCIKLQTFEIRKIFLTFPGPLNITSSSTYLHYGLSLYINQLAYLIAV